MLTDGQTLRDTKGSSEVRAKKSKRDILKADFSQCTSPSVYTICHWWDKFFVICMTETLRLNSLGQASVGAYFVSTFVQKANKIFSKCLKNVEKTILKFK